MSFLAHNSSKGCGWVTEVLLVLEVLNIKNLKQHHCFFYVMNALKHKILEVCGFAVLFSENKKTTFKIKLTSLLIIKSRFLPIFVFYVETFCSG